MQDWITLPRVPGIGVHVVRIPPGFTKGVEDFPSQKEFVDALHARWKQIHESNRARALQ